MFYCFILCVLPIYYTTFINKFGVRIRMRLYTLATRFEQIHRGFNLLAR